MTEDTLLTLAIQKFGPKVFSRLSQSQVCEALKLCDQKAMAARLGLTYEAFRWRVAKGTIPRPEIRLARRAYYSAEQAMQMVSDALDFNEACALNEIAPRQGGQT